MDHADRTDADATGRDHAEADVTGREPDARNAVKDAEDDGDHRGAVAEDGGERRGAVGAADDVARESGRDSTWESGRRNDLADDDEDARRGDPAAVREDGREAGYAGGTAERSPQRDDEHVAARSTPYEDEHVAGRSTRHDDEHAAAAPGAVTPVAGIPATAVEADVLEDPAYRDPYARTDGDLPAEPGDGRPAGEAAPAHAAPDEIVLFDQDPTEVQARWRDVQASFVDDPGEAVQRADGLVEEVVESLTSTLTSRTNALRGRWKDAGSADTEELRQAFREYRNVLERLLALSSKSPGHDQSQYQSQGTR
ncbi:hypothetical protein [Nonomuraea aridisoli]|uniref:Uncharacterized protein n=1 Tax=Nonomuraea aridisoli TaxID=2070368 RepID=A0A2W2F2L8_9ACTN|nr:hypothetical protein [Nonomuraea aridisoli]PZG20060.1 hypothetical protein C1J01_10295 [Nonomuraea aridisoli]